MQHLFVVPWLTPNRRTLHGIAVVAILVLGFFAILKSTSGGREAPAKELVTVRSLELPLFLSPRPPIQWPLSSVQPQPNLPRSCKARRWIDAPFRCRARDQNGCDTRLRGERGKRASSMPRPSVGTTGLEVGPSTVCLLSSDMAEFAMGYASLVGRH